MNRMLKTYRNNRIWCLLLCFGVLLAGLLANGAPSLAYFTAQDEVVNQAHGATLAIKLFEPQWYVKGMEMAKTMEPGMEIPKDPYVYNASEATVYVRMKVRIYQQDGNGQVLMKDGVEQTMTAEQEAAIWGIIHTKVETTTETENGEKTTVTTSEPLLQERVVSDQEGSGETQEGETTGELVEQGGENLQGDSEQNKEDNVGENKEEQEVQDVQGALTDSADGDQQDLENQDSNAEEPSETVQTDNRVSANPNFVYKDGYFYYGQQSEDGTITCTPLAPGETTTTLFDELVIPVLKTEYIGLLDSPFIIRVEAEAVTVEQIQSAWGAQAGTAAETEK